MFSLQTSFVRTLHLTGNILETPFEQFRVLLNQPLLLGVLLDTLLLLFQAMVDWVIDIT